MTHFLLPVQPISFGTSETESLSSFYSRVAILHGYGSSQLLRALRGAFAPNEKHDGESRLYTGNGLNGAGAWVQKAARLLERGLGRSDLSRLTFFVLPSQTALTAPMSRPGTKDIHRLRNWCEMCFIDDSKTEFGAYDRLLWTVSYIKRCPFHRVQLRTSCPSCHQAQKYHNMKLGLAHCYSCDAPLIGCEQLFQPDFNPHFGERECVDLVSAIASGEISSIAQDTVPRFYRTLSELHAPLHWPDRRKMKSGGQDKGARTSTTLSILVRMSIFYQVPIAQLATEPELAARSSFGLRLRSLGDLMPFGGRSFDAVLDDVRSLMLKGIAATPGVRVPTLSQISKQFGLSRFPFRQHFPELSSRYISRVRRQATAARHRTSGRALIGRLHSEGRLSHLTDGEVRSMLEDELGLQWKSARELIYWLRRLRQLGPR